MIGTSCDKFYLDRPDVVEDMAIFFSEFGLTKTSLTGMLDHVNHLATDEGWSYRDTYTGFLRDARECES